MSTKTKMWARRTTFAPFELRPALREPNRRGKTSRCVRFTNKTPEEQHSIISNHFEDHSSFLNTRCLTTDCTNKSMSAYRNYPFSDKIPKDLHTLLGKWYRDLATRYCYHSSNRQSPHHAAYLTICLSSPALNFHVIISLDPTEVNPAWGFEVLDENERIEQVNIAALVTRRYREHSTKYFFSKSCGVCELPTQFGKYFSERSTVLKVTQPDSRAIYLSMSDDNNRTNTPSSCVLFILPYSSTL
jgi:hypothetical protein